MQEKFGQLSLSRKVVAALSDMGFEEPTPIQAQAIPLVMENQDVIGQAQTGTGKTAAFGIPIVEKINPKWFAVQALILTPTRELAIQVAGEIASIGKHKQVKVLPIYGGQSIERQIRSLRFGVHVVIGTPGRILDHLERRTLNLENVKIFVLDEADEMLDMGFIEDIENILQKTPVERQTLLFSATMPLPIQRLAEKYLKNPRLITINKDTLTVPLIQQYYFEVAQGSKVDALCRILDYENYESALIFCRTKRGVDELVASLQTRGYFAEGLHGDLTQAQRDKTMKSFRQGEVDLLVATDVAARGLDIDKITHVINFDIPQDPESYVHRIGRTGRAGREGKALTLITPPEYRQLRLIEKLVKAKITRASLPSLQEVVEQQKEVIFQSLQNIVQEGNLGTYQSIALDMMSRFDPVDLTAAALKYAFTLRGVELSEVDFSADFGNTGAKPGMVRLFMTIGRQQKIRPADLVNLVANETGISPKAVGDIDIYDKFTFMEVPEDVAHRVIHIMDRQFINGKRISVQPARAK
ncbi:MAG: DEAD/DEAH box helicase [Bacillota bacterium]|uniref:ATP-dependent RNA helicase CshA n=1 Tax=Thermanaerosceptrum fracticalcis TaxID=1712410 RepID=A0A7G6E0T5_THEFR|nr:DEAD/DEAH box helicase [Thermanaerosceptrum fracticalcis]QNB45689.1 DEAD/DEAH box helicase [Thermanaerosceptrum fracticalcis]